MLTKVDYLRTTSTRSLSPDCLDLSGNWKHLCAACAKCSSFWVFTCVMSWKRSSVLHIRPFVKALSLYRVSGVLKHGQRTFAYANVITRDRLRKPHCKRRESWTFLKSASCMYETSIRPIFRNADIKVRRFNAIQLPAKKKIFITKSSENFRSKASESS